MSPPKESVETGCNLTGFRHRKVLPFRGAYQSEQILLISACPVPEMEVTPAVIQQFPEQIRILLI